MKNVSRPFRGVAAVMVGAGPAHAFYFATYEHSKQVMSTVLPQYNHLNYGMCLKVKLFQTIIYEWCLFYKF